MRLMRGLNNPNHYRRLHRRLHDPDDNRWLHGWLRNADDDGRLHGRFHRWLHGWSDDSDDRRILHRRSRDTDDNGRILHGWSRNSHDHRWFGDRGSGGLWLVAAAPYIYSAAAAIPAPVIADDRSVTGSMIPYYGARTSVISYDWICDSYVRCQQSNCKTHRGRAQIEMKHCFCPFVSENSFPRSIGNARTCQKKAHFF